MRGGDVFFNDAVDFVVINGLGAQAEWNQRVKWWSTRGSRGGSDAAPTGPQASKSVRGVIGHQLNLTKMQL